MLRHNMYFAQKGTKTQELFDTHDENQKDTRIPDKTKMKNVPLRRLQFPSSTPLSPDLRDL